MFTPGSEFPVVDWNGIKVGLLICFDIEFPEAARILALKGAQLIAIPTATLFDSKESRFIASTIVSVRAQENRVFVAFVSGCGSGYLGHSSLCGPLGRPIVKAGAEEALLVASICLDELQEGNCQYLSERRPDLYKDVCIQ